MREKKSLKKQGLKTRRCLGSRCKAMIKAKYPGLCKKCKAQPGWKDGGTEYNVLK